MPEAGFPFEKESQSIDKLFGASAQPAKRSEEKQNDDNYENDIMFG